MRAPAFAFTREADRVVRFLVAMIAMIALTALAACDRVSDPIAPTASLGARPTALTPLSPPPPSVFAPVAAAPTVRLDRSASGFGPANANAGDVPISSLTNAYVNGGDWQWVFRNGSSYFDPNYTYTATLQAQWGDPVLSVWGWDGNQWRFIQQTSQHGAGVTEQVSYRTTDNQGYSQIWFFVYGNSSAMFNFELHATPIVVSSPNTPQGGGNHNPGNASGSGTLDGVPFLWPLAGSPQSDYRWAQWDADWPFNTCGGVQKRHTGLDVLRRSGGIAWQPVVAPTSGTIKVWNGNAGAGWERFVTAEATDVTGQTFTWTVMHIIPVNDPDLANERWVERGRLIGYIADLTQYGHVSHLHYMIRRHTYDNIANRGALPQREDKPSTDPGFCTDPQGRRDPLWSKDYFIDPGQFSYATWTGLNGNTAMVAGNSGTSRW